VWFYRECDKFFDGPECHMYRFALPIDANILASRIEEQERFFDRYAKGDTESSRWDSISSQYGVEYRGDTQDFLLQRWEKELSRIREFIADTIALLHK